MRINDAEMPRYLFDQPLILHSGNDPPEMAFAETDICGRLPDGEWDHILSEFVLPVKNTPAQTAPHIIQAKAGEYGGMSRQLGRNGAKHTAGSRTVPPDRRKTSCGE